MQTLNLAFVGLGSIGTRHLRNVRAVLAEAGRPANIDVYRSGTHGALPVELAALIQQEIPLLPNQPITRQYDAVFITNPTSLHAQTIHRFAPCTKAMFIEKPVFDTPEVDVGSLGLAPDGIYYVACPLRYHPVIEYVRSHIPCDEAYAARAISSSYLPDWRPGTDYRACYSAHQDMGGGVDIDLIHEWDYLTLLFGPVSQGYAIRDRVSHLEIDSHDIAEYLAKTGHTVIELHLDYFGRKAIRQLQIFLPDETVDCDILNGTVDYRVSGNHISLDCGRDTYQTAELRHFFDILDGKCPNDSNIPGALRVLRYARGEF